ncbi:MAG: Rne/Rng family ribonuclease [Magnetococcales bacterium]|nr:Rne/Rng family ribonuclease [Magnetococcales bacterium]
MTKRMLVDATHPEEVRVAITQDNRLSDLEIEIAAKKQIKGNIYLGKVSRVEQSLQAAFIDFGHGRQGFLSLNDIHVKYFSDSEQSEDGKASPRKRGRSKKTPKAQAQVKTPEPQITIPVADLENPDQKQRSAPVEQTDTATSTSEEQTTVLPADTGSEITTEANPVTDSTVAETPGHTSNGAENSTANNSVDLQPSESLEQTATETTTPSIPAPDNKAKTDVKKPPAARGRRTSRHRPPPIQQILTRGQTILVQVVKEARGNKGASLTTNISLAGRYSVLLPENSGGGGISRKISDSKARKSLKEILTNLEVPEHVSLIIRTAGLDRTKREIIRDMNYMLRVWKKIQEKVKGAEAPCLIHEESDLITRTIRDLYTNDMEEILIEGQEYYRRGKDFMRLLMPSYVKVVQPYKGSIPIFSRYQVENQIETMHNRIVQLKSGGYLVIESTEAMVTIDINSGRATKEKDIETTAYKTNMLAAEEIARQLRLRDLGGLVVIDFIDMDDKKHNIEVEKRVEEAFKHDRARVQIGRISKFGLLELSRQRMKPAFNEATIQECPRCKGLGSIRAVESSAIYLFRCIEEEISKGETDLLVYFAPQDVVNYIFNNKRSQLVTLEQENGVTIIINGDPEMQTPEFRREKTEKNNNQNQNKNRPKEQAKKVEQDVEQQPEKTETAEAEAEPAKEIQTSDPASGPATPSAESADATPVRKKRRRRRRRRRGANSEQNQVNPEVQANHQTPEKAANDQPSRQAADSGQPSVESATTAAQATLADRDTAAVPATTAVPESGGAIPTVVPGIYVLPETTPAAEIEQLKASEEGQSSEPAVAEKKPRRRRRRRRPAAAKSPQTQADSSPQPATEPVAQPTAEPDAN